MKRKILLVEPDFPYPSKSKNKANTIHKNFVPVGLLKLGSLYKSQGARVKLVRGNQPKRKFRHFEPSLILVTSIFTYWSKYVWDSVDYYRNLFPDAKIILGGIYATLHNNRKYFIKKLRFYNVKCHVGLYSEAEKYYPDYSLMNGNVDHHVIHAMRGCIRKCAFCGVWKIEPKREDRTSEELVKEIKAVSKNRVIFFDNNFLANKNIKKILSDLAELKVNGRPVTFECQSGFDGRLLEKKPDLAELLKKARFQNVRIAWDNSLSDRRSVKRQLDYLLQAGYNARDISIFMIYNFDIPYEAMLRKLDYCGKWGVQITDCRYRPLNSVEDNYNPAKFKSGQTSEDYYIHEKAGWTDKKIRDFRKRVRQHNIWIRYAKDKCLAYDKRMEKWSSIHNTFKFFRMGRPPQLEVIEKSPT
ncbi:MAG: radical SAM protein, partial [Planctomycetota bacterium]